MGFGFFSERLFSCQSLRIEPSDPLTPRQASNFLLECADSSAPKDGATSRNKTKRGRAPALQNKTSFLPTLRVN